MLKINIDASSPPPSPSPSPEAVSQGIDLLFLGNFVHQVVNPMNAVIGTLDNLHEGIYNATDTKQKINAARAQLEQCVTLIKNLAFLSEVSSDTKILPSPSNKGISVLSQTVIEAAQFFQETASNKNIAIDLNDPSSPQYKIQGRPEALRQVFMNLFDNGVKYGLNDSKVIITSRVSKKTRHLLVEVSNESIGFLNVEAEKIFELGYRTSEAKKAVLLSTGLGLYICRKIMRDFFGGDIKAEHSNAKGLTTFTISFKPGTWSIE